MTGCCFAVAGYSRTSTRFDRSQKGQLVRQSSLDVAWCSCLQPLSANRERIGKADLPARKDTLFPFAFVEWRRQQASPRFLLHPAAVFFTPSGCCCFPVVPSFLFTLSFCLPLLSRTEQFISPFFSSLRAL